MNRRILLLPGDGIGPEVVREAKKVLEVVAERYALQLEFREANLGGAAIDAEGGLTRLPLKPQREKQMRYCLEQWVVHSGTVSRQLSGPSGVVGDQGGSGSFLQPSASALIP